MPDFARVTSCHKLWEINIFSSVCVSLSAPYMFKLVHYEARTIGELAVGIQLQECIPVGCAPAACWPYAWVCFWGGGLGGSQRNPPKKIKKKIPKNEKKRKKKEKKMGGRCHPLTPDQTPPDQTPPQTRPTLETPWIRPPQTRPPWD